MKSLTFNKNSWHYLIASMVGYAPYEYGNGHERNICTYSKYVVGGIIVLLVMGAGIAGFGFLFFQVFFGIVFSLIYGMWLMSATGEAALILTGFFGSIALLGLAWLAHKRRLERDRFHIRPDGFVKNAYKSWKEKFCLKIEFTE
jgi:ABC-type multidrug transport system permease subunit